MTGDELRTNPIHKASDAFQMPMIDSCHASNRDADAMDGDRIVARQFDKKLAGVGVREKILGVNFEPWNGGSGGHHFGNMSKPQTYSCTRFPLLCILRHDDHPIPRRLLCCLAGADDAVAVAFRDIDPRFWICVEF